VRDLEVAWSQVEALVSLEAIEAVTGLDAPGAASLGTLQAAGIILGQGVDQTEEWGILRVLVGDKVAGEMAEGAAEGEEPAYTATILGKLKEVELLTERSQETSEYLKYYLDTVKWAERSRVGKVSDTERALVGGGIACHCLYKWLLAHEALRVKRLAMAADAPEAPAEEAPAE